VSGYLLTVLSEYGYPRHVDDLAQVIDQPKFSSALSEYLYCLSHPDVDPLPTLRTFDGTIHVHHSAKATYFAPSDLCGSGGLQRETIRSTPRFRGHPRRDCVFVEVDANATGIRGMLIARVLLFFSINYHQQDRNCALVNWFVYDKDDPIPDPETTFYMVHSERDRQGNPEVQVISTDSIIRAAHLLPIYGNHRVPRDVTFSNILDKAQSFFINHFVDHHVHELVVG
jgi:hypothetical protein